LFHPSFQIHSGQIKSDLGVKISGDPEEYVRKFGFEGYISTSALTGENIDEAVRSLVSKIISRIT